MANANDNQNPDRGAGSKPPKSEGDPSIAAPRLTPQGRASSDASGEDATAPDGKGAKKGQGDKAEG